MKENTKPTVLALFDVLGWMNRHRSAGLPARIRALQTLQEVVRRRQDCLIIDATIPIGQTSEGYPITGSAIGALVVQHTDFSDTFILWAVFDRARFWTFCDICAELFCELLSLNIPPRGAITVGEAYMHNSSRTYTGRALDEAAYVEKAQSWVGVSFGPSFDNPPYKTCFRSEHLQTFTAHRKPGEGSQYISGKVLDWPRKWRRMFKESACRKLAYLDCDTKYSKYYRHAIAFVEKSERVQLEEARRENR